jgi:hypothetical protein
MYYPYLYGKQKELLAVRELAPRLAAEGVVQPVIEPVRSNTTLPITLAACERTAAATFVVVNPIALEFVGMSAAQSYRWGVDLFADLQERLKADPRFVYPALLVSSRTTSSHIAEFQRDFAGKTVGYVCRDPSLTTAELATAIGTMSPGGRIFWHNEEPSTVALALLHKSRCVWVESRFPHRLRNADYGGLGPFSDRHLTFRATGYGGFSDFGVLPPVAKDGGGRPGAVAFHMTYKDLSAGDLHIEHFVSDRTDQKDNDDGGKFMEALAKFNRSSRRRTSSFGLTAAASEYLERFSRSNPPSLGTSKQLQVSHHLELVSGILTGRF